MRGKAAKEVDLEACHIYAKHNECALYVNNIIIMYILLLCFDTPVDVYTNNHDRSRRIHTNDAVSFK